MRLGIAIGAAGEPCAARSLDREAFAGEGWAGLSAIELDRGAMEALLSQLAAQERTPMRLWS